MPSGGFLFVVGQPLGWQLLMTNFLCFCGWLEVILCKLIYLSPCDKQVKKSRDNQKKSRDNPNLPRKSSRNPCNGRVNGRCKNCCSKTLWMQCATQWVHYYTSGQLSCKMELQSGDIQQAIDKTKLVLMMSGYMLALLLHFVRSLQFGLNFKYSFIRRCSCQLCSLQHPSIGLINFVLGTIGVVPECPLG